MSKKRKEVVYISDPSIAQYDFTFLVPQHAMKPWRLAVVDALVRHLNLEQYMRVVTPPKLAVDELCQFHSKEYLGNLALHNFRSWLWHPETSVASFSSDCPPFEGMLEFGCAVAACSIMGSVLLNAQEADIVINWAGGMHHARCSTPQGFCYINDIVLAIIELLKTHRRVLYVDIDVHHGDGVEEAFYTTNRVFTLSLHKFGENFYPGTGSSADIGIGDGRYFAMNIPLFDGINDFQYTDVFATALAAVVQRFEPTAVVMQCGGDSVCGDRVGTFNLSSIGHARCVEMVAQLGLPLLVLGGGGYTVRHVSRLWAYETSILCGAPIPLSTCLSAALEENNSSAAVTEEDVNQPELSERIPIWLFHPEDTLLVPAESVLAPVALTAATTVDAIKRQITHHAMHIYAPE